MTNVEYATDDGSLGKQGTVVDLFIEKEKLFSLKKIRIFACGPNPMLAAVRKIALTKNFECQLSTECAMACGFGICQGCPIETGNEESYKLVCKDGPVFEAREVIL